MRPSTGPYGGQPAIPAGCKHGVSRLLQHAWARRRFAVYHAANCTTVAVTGTTHDNTRHLVLTWGIANAYIPSEHARHRAPRNLACKLLMLNFASRSPHIFSPAIDERDVDGVMLCARVPRVGPPSTIGTSLAALELLVVTTVSYTLVMSETPRRKRTMHGEILASGKTASACAVHAWL